MLKLVDVLAGIDGISNIVSTDKSKRESDRFLEIATFMFDGKRFEIAIPEKFPYKLPCITSLDKIVHSHIDSNGTVCLPNLDEIVYDTHNEDKIIQLSIYALKKLFSMSEDENYIEILYEYNDYLSIYTNYDNSDRKIYLLSDSKESVLTICKDKNNKEYCFIGDSSPFLDEFKKENGIGAVTAYKCVRLDLKKVPMPKYNILTVRDIIECLDEMSLKTINKYKNTSYTQYYLLRYRNPDNVFNYILITGFLDKSIKKTNCLLYGAQLSIARVINVSLDYLRKRGGSHVFDDKVLVVGCGSVGSEICDQLAASGFNNLTIVDPDDLLFENGFRNETGLRYILFDKSFSKVDIMQFELKTKYKNTNVEVFKNDIVDSIKKKDIDLTEYKYIVSCTGNTIVDSFLNEYLYTNKIETILIIAWLEPYGIAEHILSIDTRKKGCFECFLKSPRSIQLCSNDGEYYKIRNNVCSGSYTPYGRLSTIRLAVNVVDMMIGSELNRSQIVNSHLIHKGKLDTFLEKGFKKTVYMEYSNEQLNKHNRDFIMEGCKVCGKFDY